VRTLAEVESAAAAVLAKSLGDAVIWFAYPKASSRRYRCEFNRDSGWAEVGKAGFESVRQVAIDEDWSALRFRRVEYVKKMTRDAPGRSSKEEQARGGKTGKRADQNAAAGGPPDRRSLEP